MSDGLSINGRRISKTAPVYIIAEMSANHNQDFEKAARIIQAAKDAGADAIKLQTYTPDTLTIDCDNNYFRIGKGSIWQDRTLHGLYSEAYTPWDWQPKLKIIAEELGLDFFSTPFDHTAVDFLENIGVPAYKIASFELVDLPLLRKVAATQKPVIMSTGMATMDEIEEAVGVLRGAGNKELALLKCTSAYPAPMEEINLVTLSDLANTFGVVAGLSDHSLGYAIPVAAVALGACIVEKHFCLSRSDPGPDSLFSLEPGEFKAMVQAVREVEKALGTVHYGCGAEESKSRVFRRSLFVIKAVRAGEVFSSENIRSIRPAYGMHTRNFEEVLGLHADCDIPRGTPLAANLIRERKISFPDGGSL